MKRNYLCIIAILLISPIDTLAYYEQCYGYKSIKNSNYPCGAHGNCTWWAAYKRPDIKGLKSLGDAGMWSDRAKNNHGYSVGTKPAVGAVAVFSSGTWGHVASVEDVYDDGSFFVTEMDWTGFFGDGMSRARYYPDGDHYHRLPYGAIYPKGLQGDEYKLSGFIYYRSCMFLNDDTGVICWDFSSDGQFTWPEDAYYFTLYKKDKKGGCTESIFDRSKVSETARGRAYFDEVSKGKYGEYPNAKYVDLGVYCANGKPDEGNLTGIGGIGGAGYSTSPTEPPTSGKLPDFITSKVTIGNKDGKEDYNWKVNEIAYVHSWTDNIGTADWEGKAKKIKVPFYLSKGNKEDSHSEWVRVGREEIKKDHLDVKDKPKHEKIAFNIQEWAAAGYIYPGRNYNFVVCADRPKDQDNGDGDVKEIHKSNNCSTPAVFYVDYGPARNVDLITNNLTLTGGKTALQAGESYGLQAELSNIGTEYPWNGCRTSYEIKGPGTGDVWQKVTDEGSTLAQLAPNSTKVEVIDESRGLKAPSVGGDYVFRACADYEQAIPETDEGNNCTAELPITVTVPPPPSVNPYIVITNPTSSDDWRSSETDHDVRWDYFDFPEKGHVKVEYSLDGGATWLLIDDETTNDGKKHWEDMCDFYTIDTHHAYIRVTSLEYPNVSDVSDEFSIDHAKECK